MRVALVSDWWAPRIGGIESQLTDLAGELVRRGHRVRVLTTTPDAIAPAGVTVEHVAWPMVGDIAVPDIRRIADLVRRLAREPPDVVHAHGMFSPIAVGAVVAAHRLGLPSVATVHSLLAPWPVFLAGRAVFFLFTNRASLVTAVSEAVAVDVARASGRPAIVVPNGLDVDAWRVPRAPPAEAHEVRVVSVLRLVPKKRPHDLLDAFAIACRANALLKLTLTIAGAGPMRAELERAVVRRGIADRVAFAGGCTRGEVRALLARASILAHPGAHEAFGLALLEARAAGVPVVAMAAGGVPEIVEHARTGLLARTGEEFGRHLASLCADQDLRGRLAAAAREHLERFAWPAVAARYEEAYERAANAAR